MAVALRQPPEGCIHHADRGLQYCSGDYQKQVSKHGFRVSISGKGKCHDKAMVETCLKSIKAMLIWRNRWETRRQTEMTIFEHINDRVDAPPGGIAMCQNGRSLICHPNEEHPWTMLAS
jgi:putative transposase